MDSAEKEQLKIKVLEALGKVGDYIKLHRQATNLKLSELAERSGISPSVISDLENHKGVIPNIYTIIAISNALEISLEEVTAILKSTQPEKFARNRKDEVYDTVKQALLRINLSQTVVAEILDFIEFKSNKNNQRDNIENREEKVKPDNKGYIFSKYIEDVSNPTARLDITGTNYIPKNHL